MKNKTKTRPRCLPEWRAGQTLVLHLDVDGVLAHCCRRERDVNTRWRPLHLDGDAALVDTCTNDTKKEEIGAKTVEIISKNWEVFVVTDPLTCDFNVDISGFYIA